MALDIPWLKDAEEEPRFFPRSTSPSKRPQKRARFYRRRETWLYRVEMELTSHGSGVIKLYRYDKIRPIAKASFLNREEGNSLFEEVWQAVQEKTEEENEKYE